MKLGRKWLEKKKACKEGVEWFLAQDETDVVKIIKKLIKEEKLDWANWLITKKMTKKQCVAYAIYAAEQVIKNFEKEFPDDKRPREAIRATKRYLKSPRAKNRSAAESAWSVARSAAESAWSTWSAWSIAWSAAESAESAAWSAWSAAESAALIKILKYGIKLIK